jgi:hypothetical protein
MITEKTVLTSEDQSDLATMLGIGPDPKLEDNDDTLGEDGMEESSGEDEETEDRSEEPDAEGSEYTKEGEGDSEKGEEAAEGAEAEAEGEAPTEITKLQEQIQTLTALVEKVAKEKEEAKPEDEGPEALPEMDFIGSDTDIDVVTTDVAELNKVLHKVADYAYNKAIESTLRAIPNMVVKVARVEVQQQAMANEFYRANDDLVPHKVSVAKIYTEMIEKNPEKNPYDLLKTLAPVVRERLKLKSRQKMQPKKNPAFAPGTSRGQRGLPPKEKGSIGKEIKEMMDLR